MVVGGPLWTQVEPAMILILAASLDEGLTRAQVKHILCSLGSSFPCPLRYHVFNSRETCFCDKNQGQSVYA